MKRSLLVPGMLVSALFAMRCTSGGDASDDDGTGGTTAGKGGGAGVGAGAGTGGKAGSGGKGGTAGSTSSVCDPGDTRTCVGPGSCDGGQVCRDDGSGWEDCDCGTSTGGTGGSGNSGGEGGEGATMSSGGSGGTGGSGGDAGSGAVSGTGGTNAGGAGSGGTSGAGATSGAGGAGAGGAGAGGAGAGGTNAGGAGAGGTGNGGAGSGGGGTAGCANSPGLELIPAPGQVTNTGWVDRDTNCINVEGSVYLQKDVAASNIYSTSMNGHVCVAGHVEQVVNNDFATQWGVVVVFQLNNVGGNALPYDATPNGIDGFKFTLSGANIPSEIRPRYRVDGSAAEYCRQICATGTQSILFSDAHPSCWTGGNSATPNTTQLTLIEFHIPSRTSGDVTFDFCIDDVTAITDSVSVGNPGTCGGGGSGGAGGAGGTGGTGGAGAGGTSGSGGTSGGGGTAGSGNSDDSCVGNCGGPSNSGDCWCDLDCETNGDCCTDYAPLCGSCVGICGDEAPGGCWCDSDCETNGDCCGDYDSVCAGG